MNTIAFVLAGVVLGLVILAKIPGLEHFVRPTIDLLFTALKAILENGLAWSIWAFKSLWNAHVDLVRHLIYSAETLDPTVSVKENEE